MGVLQRFKDIMSSNINALLDKAEDPEKMIDQTMRNLQSDLEKVKKETAAVMADEAKAKRDLDECQAKVDKMQDYATKAVLAGNDDDATKFLTEKSRLASELEMLQTNYDVAAENSKKMRDMHDKLVKDIAELDRRKEAVKAKVRVAKAREDVNKMTANVSSSASSFAAFERIENKADAMLDRANAEAELNKSTTEATIDNLTDKYDSASDVAVSEELAKLKESLGVTGK